MRFPLLSACLAAIAVSACLVTTRANDEEPAFSTFPGGPQFHYNDPSASGPTGVSQDGLALAVTPLTVWKRVGEPVWIEVELRNVSPDEVVVSGLTPYSWDIAVTRPQANSQVTPYPRYQDRWDAYRSGFGTLVLPRGSSAFAAIHVDRLVPLNAPGTYAVRIFLRVPKTFYTKAHRGTSPLIILASNELSLNLLPNRQKNPWPADEHGVGEGVVGTAPTGNAVGGFALALSSDLDPIDLVPGVVVELRNVTEKPRKITFGSRDTYDFTIKNLRTGQIIATAHSTQANWTTAPWSGKALYPDTSLYARFSLTQTYHLTPDRYRVYVVGHPTIEGRVTTLVSNTIEFKAPFVKPTLPLKRPMASLLDLTLQSNRPVYVVEQPVLLRATLASKVSDPIIIWGIGSNDSLSATYGGPYQGSTTQKCRIWMPPSVFRPWAMELRPGLPGTFLDFRYDSPWGHDFTSMGCTFDAPGTYTLIGDARLEGVLQTFDANYRLSYNEPVASAPLTIRVLTKAEANQELPAILKDQTEDTLLRALLAEYCSLRAPIVNAISRLERRAPQSEGRSQSQDEESGLDAFKARVEAVAGFGGPASPYVHVAANLGEAQWHLWKAHSDIYDQCDPVAARNEMRIADYFATAVNNEVSRGRASVADTADPPASIANGRCH